MMFCIICKNSPASFIYVGNGYCRPHFNVVYDPTFEGTPDHPDVTSKES